MRWIALSVGILVGVWLISQGRRFYKKPQNMYPYWYDTNRVHLAWSKLAGGILIFTGLFCALTVLIVITGRLDSWESHLVWPVALLGAILLRPRGSSQIPWQRKRRWF